MTPIIELEHVTKAFRGRRERVLLGLGGLGDFVKGRKRPIITALDDVCFTVEAGESLGIIGANGSGKSTLLKIVAGVTLPSSGSVTVRGRVASLLELGAGFHPMLTGRENIYLNAGLLGLRHADVDQVFDQIVAFSGIGPFLNNSVDTYSSGMFVRLGFAVAVHTNPDIFLVDEVLSVGDEEFQRKCSTRIGELREQGKTILFVSHDLGAVSSICGRVLLLSAGRTIVRNTPQETVSYYLEEVARKEGVHTIKSGPLVAQFDHGMVRIVHEGRELTHAVHLYNSALIGKLWHDSTHLAWEPARHEGQRIEVAGRSRRLPFRLEWHLEPIQDGLAFQAWIDALEPLDVQEYHASVLLKPAYERWETSHEAGLFPEISPQQNEWLHLNHDFSPGTHIKALSSSLPSVTLTAANTSIAFRMTALNTGRHQGARVLQALRTPDSGVIHFEKGRHLYFSGFVTVTP